MPGGKPSVSNRLTDYLNQPDADSDELIEDAFDVLIHQEQVRISRCIVVRELDLLLFVLNNRWVISQTLSAYPLLDNASDDALTAYTTSASGIHWPEIDADLSLRGLLMGEVVRQFMSA